MKKIKEKESEIQKSILEYLKLRGIFVWANKTQGTYDPVRKVFRRNTTIRGVSDILGIMPVKSIKHAGRFIALEVKTSKGKTNPYQEQFLSKVIENGGIGEVVRSIEDVDKILTNLL